MFISYCDDSGTGDKDKPFQVMTSVLMHDRFFQMAEIFAIGSIAAFIPDEKQEAFLAKFGEFKGWELFGGYGPFDGIEQAIRFKIITFLLQMVKGYGFPVIFGAVDKAELRKQVYSSANPLDICFRTCLRGIQQYIRDNAKNEIALVIVDESKTDKKTLRSAFLDHREKLRPKENQQVPCFHDDMYFGDSKYSIGIQLADLCGYFIAKHLEKDAVGDAFYALIEPYVMYSRIEPGAKNIHPTTPEALSQ